MEIGDRIISVNNENINHSHQLAEMVFNDDISVLIDREGQEFEFILSHENEVDEMYFTYSSFGLLAHTQGFGSYGIRSIAEGFHQTIFVTEMIFTALRDLIVDLFTGQAETENLAGPVGIVSIVGEARTAGGFIALLQLTAFLSINLALLNIIPFPALDGGRIMVVLVELIIRRPIPQKALMWINGLGFLSLILLMIAVTVQDVIKLF